MSTRGSWGLRLNGVTKETYNHCDSYPNGLGVQLAVMLQKVLKDSGDDRKALLKELKEMYGRITVVGFDDRATEAQIEKFRKYAREDVADGELEDFYVLLRETQFNPLYYYEDKELTVMNPNNGDNEFSYLIDLDRSELRVTCHRARKEFSYALEPITISELDLNMADLEDDLAYM